MRYLKKLNSGELVEIPFNLGSPGFVYGQATNSEIDLGNVAVCQLLVTDLKPGNREVSSYYLKHIFEALSCRYVTNGEAIIAMICRGFEYRRSGINAVFLLDDQGVKDLEDLREEVLNWSNAQWTKDEPGDA